MLRESRPWTLTIAALGGQGGGVVQGWMIDVAQRSGYQVQATSVPGVAQRTGATIYYLEFVEPSAETPVMALMPAGGNCDLIVASELAEAVRMVERRLVDPAMTTVVTSTHRAYTIDERSHRADGRADADELMDVLKGNAARVVAFDMERVAIEHESVISAAILGGIAGAQVLPFEPDAYRAAIRSGGRGVERSLAAFEAALRATRASPSTDSTTASTAAEGQSSDRFANKPDELAFVLEHAAVRLEDYQDAAYADEYRARIEPFIDRENPSTALVVAVARGLALWMTFEDTIRVADLKTRPERLARLMDTPARSIAHVSDFLRPRVEEIAGTLPLSVGRWVEQSPAAGRALAFLTKGLKVRTTNVFGYLLLRCIARLRPIRRRTLRFHREMEAIDAWLDNVQRLRSVDPALALELARCQELVSGYGETHTRGLASYRQIVAVADRLVGRPDAAERIARLRENALGPEAQSSFDDALKETETEMTWGTA